MTTASVWVWLLECAALVTSLAGHWLLQSTLVIAGGLVAARLLRGRGPALQSVIYRTTLVAACLCPIVTGLLASAGLTLGISILPDVRVARFETLAVEPSATGNELARAEQAGQRFDAQPVSSSELLLAGAPPQYVDSPLSALDDAGAHELGAEPVANVPCAAPANLGTQHAAPAVQTVQAWVVRPVAAATAIVVTALWFLGATILLMRLLVAHLRLLRLRQIAVRAAEDQQRLCHELSTVIGLPAPEVLTTPFVSGPCLSGVWCPAILLPDELPEIPLSNIFVHELAHLRRRDCLWSLVRQASAAVLFFQPLIWRLSQELETTAEEVCDDHVVKHGADRHSYADTLVSLAEWSKAPVASAVVPLVAFRSMLGHRVTRILDRTRRLSLSVSLTALVVVVGSGLAATLGAGALGPAGRRTEEAGRTPGSPAADRAEVQQLAAQKLAEGALPDSLHDHDRSVTVQGYVVDPRGERVAGADVVLVRPQGTTTDASPIMLATRTDAVGEFSVAFRESQLADPWRASAWRQATIVAMAPGLAPAWLRCDEVTPGPNNVLRLVDDEPVTGRIVDADGQPISGVSVRLESIRTNKREDLTDWLTSVGSRHDNPSPGQVMSVPLAASWPVAINMPNSLTPSRQLSMSIAALAQATSTDAEGRYYLRGVGRNRLALLRVSGGGVAAAQFEVAARRSSTTQGPNAETSAVNDTDSTYTYVAQRARLVRGTVRDASTRQPLVGARVIGYRSAGARGSGVRVVETVTDHAGCYELDGLPQREGNEIVVVPAADQPYLLGRSSVTAAESTEPVTLDVALRRGVWITGRLSDRDTGEPVRGTVTYAPLPDNELAVEFAEFDRGRSRLAEFRRRTDAEGHFRVVGMPGHGALEVKCSMERAYLQGQVIRDPLSGAQADFADMLTTSQLAATAIREIRPSAAAHEIVADVSLDCGLQVPLALVDPQGRPLAGVAATGLWPRSQPRNLLEIGPSTVVVGMRHDEQRLVLLHHAERNLGQVLRLSPDASSVRPRAVTLQPCARLSGRLVDGDGQPVAGALIGLEMSNREESAARYRVAASDADGRFSSLNVLPGCTYNVVCHSASGASSDIARNIEVSAGQSIDLGNIDISVEFVPTKHGEVTSRSRGAATVEVAASRF